MINVQKMDEVLWHKFNQHSDLKHELICTGNAELVENSDNDSFWGIGPNGSGRNELGKALERLRAKLALQQQPASSHALSVQPKPRNICFGSGYLKYYGFTTFSPHIVNFEGKSYPTAEHLFQSMKFIPARPDIAEYMRTFGGGPQDVKELAEQYRIHIRHDWFQINTQIMANVLQVKFSQHPDLADELWETGTSWLFFDCDDEFWGIGSGSGRNELGRLLEKLRHQYYRS
ncbi:hypothetical protein BDQ17DRAFT_1409482, partial [Cyathus striatus]